MPSHGNLVVYQCQNFKGFGPVSAERNSKRSDAKSILWFRPDTCQIVSFFFIHLFKILPFALTDFAINMESHILLLYWKMSQGVSRLEVQKLVVF